MARTESKTLTCFPDEEQEMIDTMQQFHWSLLSSQEVKVVDSHIEKGWISDKVYSVTKTDHHIKLAFSREIDLPNLSEIRKLEEAYFNLHIPGDSSGCLGCSLLGVSLFVAFVIFVLVSTGDSVTTFDDNSIAGAWASGAWLVGTGLAYYFLLYAPRSKKAEEIRQSIEQQRREILSELKKFD